MHKRKITTNHSTTQWKGLTKLQNNEDIIIKEADRGIVGVIMDTLYYENLVISMLYESQHNEKYHKLHPTQKIMKNLSSLIKTHGKEPKAKKRN